MSPIFVIAPFLALVGSLIVWLVIIAITRRWSNAARARRMGCLFAAMLFPFLTVALFVGLPRTATESGFGVSPQVANSGLMTFSIPETASNVNFRHEYFSGVIDAADFEIAENDFLKWVKEQGWTPREFGAAVDHVLDEPEMEFNADDFARVYPVTISGGAEMIEVHTGYEIIDDGEITNDDAFLHVVYDKEAQRAYVSRNTY